MVRAALVVFLAAMFVNAAAQSLPRKGGLPEEVVEGVEIRYGEVRTEKGYRVRTYTSRPKGVPGAFRSPCSSRGSRAIASRIQRTTRTVGRSCFAW